MVRGRHIDRRTFLKRVAATSVIGVRASRCLGTREADAGAFATDDPDVAKIGAGILASRGNAVDAAVAAAFVAAVAAPSRCGVGGYGACAILAVDGGRRIVALDANTIAPAAMTADLFKPVGGKVPGAVNEYGWLAAGVPGTLAGLERIQKRFGTMPFAEVLKPAIRVAREGSPWSAHCASLVRDRAEQFGRDPGLRKLVFRGDRPLAAGEPFRNPDLADLLESLARKGSASDFYRGDIALRIAEAFAKHGGLVTAQDMAAYEARLVEPLAIACGRDTILTPPPTAGGLTTLQALQCLQALRWHERPAGVARTHAQIEALRLAWHDRLTLLGDPDSVTVPSARLLSDDYARESAERVAAAVKAGSILPYDIPARDQNGTINVTAADREGNFIALTLTHGNGFGARVAVEGLGLILGHGMSRFDPEPGRPNSPGPRKRPLHNMTPVLVVRDGRPVLCLGGSGGRRIPNAAFEVLARFLTRREPLRESVQAPRMHTTGTADLELESRWPEGEKAALASMGYKIKTAASAVISAVAVEDGRIARSVR